MLSINKIRENSFVKPEEMCVDDGIRKAVEILRPITQQKQIAVQIKSNNRDNKIITDKALFTQAILNIINHAVRATGLGENIEIESIFDPDYISISVKDSGKGISIPEIKRVMNDEVSGHNKEELELTRKIIRLLKGEMEIKSNLGSGSTIIIKLPIVNE